MPLPSKPAMLAESMSALTTSGSHGFKEASVTPSGKLNIKCSVDSWDGRSAKGSRPSLSAVMRWRMMLLGSVWWYGLTQNLVSHRFTSRVPAGMCRHMINNIRATELVPSIFASGLTGLMSGAFMSASGQIKQPCLMVQLFKRSSAVRYLMGRDMDSPYVK